MNLSKLEYPACVQRKINTYYHQNLGGGLRRCGFSAVHEKLKHDVDARGAEARDVAVEFGNSRFLFSFPIHRMKTANILSLSTAIILSASLETAVAFPSGASSTSQLQVNPSQANAPHVPQAPRLVKRGFFKSKSSINARDQDGNTKLFVAARDGDLNTVVNLLQSGAKVNKRDPNGMTPLMIAVENRREDIVDALLGVQDIDVRAGNNRGQTAMYLAAEQGDLAIMQKLHEAGASIHSVTLTYQTPLTVAAYGGYTNVVEWILREGGCFYYELALQKAAMKGHAGTASALLSRPMSKFPMAALGEAIYYGHPGVVRVIMEKARKNNLETADGIRFIDQPDKAYGLRPLVMALKKGSEEIVSILIEYGADLNIRDWNHDTPIMKAIKNGHPAIALMLLGTGRIDVHAQDVHGKTAKVLAEEYGQTKIAEMLALAEMQPPNELYKAPPIKLVRSSHGNYHGLSDGVQFAGNALSLFALLV